MSDVPHGTRLQPMRSLAEIAWVWAQIIAALALVSYSKLIWVYPVAVIFIAARQYALAVLLHEGQHRLLHPRRQINDWIARWLLAAPLGSDLEASRRSHMAHHRYLGKRMLDPDYPIYAEGRLRRRAGASHSARSLGGILTAQIGIGAVLTLLASFWGYCLLWLFPLALAGILDRLRIKAEHDAQGRIYSHISNPVERFFLAPFHMERHAEHHVWPHVPHYRLPAKRGELAGVMPLAEWMRGTYFASIFQQGARR